MHFCSIYWNPAESDASRYSHHHQCHAGECCPLTLPKKRPLRGQVCWGKLFRSILHNIQSHLQSVHICSYHPWFTWYAPHTHSQHWLFTWFHTHNLFILVWTDEARDDVFCMFCFSLSLGLGCNGHYFPTAAPAPPQQQHQPACLRRYAVRRLFHSCCNDIH